jgi:hypothetical protein
MQSLARLRIYHPLVDEANDATHKMEKMDPSLILKSLIAAAVVDAQTPRDDAAMGNDTEATSSVEKQLHNPTKTQSGTQTIIAQQPYWRQRLTSSLNHRYQTIFQQASISKSVSKSLCKQHQHEQHVWHQKFTSSKTVQVLKKALPNTIHALTSSCTCSCKNQEESQSLARLLEHEPTPDMELAFHRPPVAEISIPAHCFTDKDQILLNCTTKDTKVDEYDYGGFEEEECLPAATEGLFEPMIDLDYLEYRNDSNAAAEEKRRDDDHNRTQPAKAATNIVANDHSNCRLKTKTKDKEWGNVERKERDEGRFLLLEHVATATAVAAVTAWKHDRDLHSNVENEPVVDVATPTPERTSHSPRHRRHRHSMKKAKSMKMISKKKHVHSIKMQHSFSSRWCDSNTSKGSSSPCSSYKEEGSSYQEEGRETPSTWTLKSDSTTHSRTTTNTTELHGLKLIMKEEEEKQVEHHHDQHTPQQQLHSVEWAFSNLALLDRQYRRELRRVKKRQNHLYRQSAVVSTVELGKESMRRQWEHKDEIRLLHLPMSIHVMTAPQLQQEQQLSSSSSSLLLEHMITDEQQAE